jgi:hypothetical protein
VVTVNTGTFREKESPVGFVEGGLPERRLGLRELVIERRLHGHAHEIVIGAQREDSKK